MIRRKAISAIERFFDSKSAEAIGVHGTSTDRLAKIESSGLKPSLDGFTYFAISKDAILKKIQSAGVRQTRSELIKVIKGNFDHAIKRISGSIKLEHYGLVLGKVPKIESKRFGAPGGGGITKDNILLTLRLSNRDIKHLKNKFPTLKETPLRRGESLWNPEIQSIYAEMARIFADKIINNFMKG